MMSGGAIADTPIENYAIGKGRLILNYIELDQ
jgi:hypothetical protein